MDMHLDVKRVAASTTAALLVVLGAGSGIAAADDVPTDSSVVIHTEPPQETDPADTGLVDVPADQVGVEPDIPGSGDTGSGNHPGSEYCDRQTVYTPTYKGGDHHKGIGAQQANTNNTSHTAKSTFTAEVSGTVGVTFSGTLSTSVDVMIAKIETKYDVSLSASLTARLGNSISVDTPPHKITHATYGVYRLRNQGKSYVIYSNCQTSAKSTVTSYTPHYVGWYIWEKNA
ncbi:hypothetical protein [Streptomyces griseoruber]|uniref:hypothetical protein n=1 Tax=Streptomyces griseoruber TaxID=1943 RepID=UPI000AA8C951|nr:hypothetical protein [Streptomyces griseoruber]